VGLVGLESCGLVKDYLITLEEGRFWWVSCSFRIRGQKQEFPLKKSYFLSFWIDILKITKSNIKYHYGRFFLLYPIPGSKVGVSIKKKLWPSNDLENQVQGQGRWHHQMTPSAPFNFCLKHFSLSYLGSEKFRWGEIKMGHPVYHSFFCKILFDTKKNNSNNSKIIENNSKKR